MPNEIKNISWSKSILHSYNWTHQSLFEFLESVPERKFQENRLIKKAEFIKKLKILIYCIERNGDLVKEAKEMVAPGSIIEFLESDYKNLKNIYLKERKLLANRLCLINNQLK